MTEPDTTTELGGVADAEPPPSKSIARRVVGAMILAVVFYGGFVVYRGLADVAASYREYAWWTFAGACGLAFVNYILRFFKWEYYLRVLGIRGVGKVDSFLIFLSGFVLTVTPGKVGEVFKSYVLEQTHGVPFERSAPIVVAERLTDLIGVIVMIAVGSIGLAGGIIWAVVGAAVVAFILLFVGQERLSGFILEYCERLPGWLGRTARKIAPKVRTALEKLKELTRARHLIIPSLLSICGWSLEGGALWLILKGFAQTTGPFATAFFYATATLAGALVPVPGGLGITGGLLETQMAQVGGIAPVISTSAMLLIRLATLWFAVVVGFFALIALRSRHPGLKLGADGVSGKPSSAPNT